MKNHSRTNGQGQCALRETFFKRFSVAMPEECVADCSHSGDCLADVIAWHGRIDLSAISDMDLAAELSEYGAWDNTELQSREDNERRILWIAAGNISEELLHE